MSKLGSLAASSVLGLSLLSLTACDESPPSMSGDSPSNSSMSGDSASSSSGAVLTVRELLEQVAPGGQATVDGGFVLNDGKAVLCDEQEESDPPICRVDPTQVVRVRNYPPIEELDAIERGPVAYAFPTIRVSVVSEGVVDIIEVVD